MARKRQEQEMKAKKLQQIEEDHRMGEELFKQRQEKEVSIHNILMLLKFQKLAQYEFCTLKVLVVVLYAAT